jgi:hypothetical protein
MTLHLDNADEYARGMLLGQAVIIPGRYSRKEVNKLRGRVYSLVKQDAFGGGAWRVSVITWRRRNDAAYMVKLEVVAR